MAKKSTKKRSTKKTVKRKVKKSKKPKKRTSSKRAGSRQVIIIQQKEGNRPFRRVAGEQAVGGAAAGFGIAAGHEFGEWLFD